MSRLRRQGSSLELRRALFPQGFEGEAMRLIHETWQTFARRSDVHREEPITALFADALEEAYARKDLPWFVSTEVPVTDAESGEQLGRNDLRFYHRGIVSQKIFFTVECKRLHVTTDSGFRPLDKEYVEEGLARFVAGKYAMGLPCGGMLGYVLDNKVEVAFGRVIERITGNQTLLKIKLAKSIKRPSALLPDCSHSADTVHDRNPNSFTVHHLLVGAATRAKHKKKG